MDAVLGLDVGKREIHAALIVGTKTARKSVANSQGGFAQLSSWLRNKGVDCVHACMESTGALGDALALYLHDSGHVISLVNPARIKAYGQSELLRTKTDTVDAALIARFCIAQKPGPWTPPAPEIRRLQALLRRLESLLDMRTQELNRLSGPELDAIVQQTAERLVQAINEQISEVERHIAQIIDDNPHLRERRDRISTIPGIGRKTAEKILGEMPQLDSFRNVKAVGAFAGLSPQHHASGTIIRKSRISKTGSPLLRKLLFLPALAAMRYNPVLRAFAARLRARGKASMVIVVAVMRRLLTLAYGVLKSGRPWDPALAA